mmetsp:Transcript_1704/g.2446  ORF Transcript_1704/g.2446 Transcript_1704/m.2446 type:complete len:369 (-) Transcript_1704:360-1466(-)
MPLSIPSELKKITQFIRRAEELDRDQTNPESRLVAYYCRQYAVQQGIPLAKSSPAAAKCLGDILGKLEEEKDAMSNFSKEESKIVCRAFADKIFNKADAADRRGADTSTAKIFYAAATFFEILLQFYSKEENEGEKSEEQVIEDEKRVYSKWKATEILKAIREGRTPTPGGYVSEKNEVKKEEDEDPAEGTNVEEDSPMNSKEESSDDEEEVESNGMLNSSNQPQVSDDDDGNDKAGVGFGAPPSYTEISDDSKDVNEESDIPIPPLPPPTAPSAPTNRPPLSAPSFQPPPLPTPMPLPMPPQSEPKKNVSFLGFGGSKSKSSKKREVSQSLLNDATELTKFALAALKTKDTALAAERLREALNCLEG